MTEWSSLNKGNQVLVLLDQNARAAIASLRALAGAKLPLLLGVRKLGFTHRMAFGQYMSAAEAVVTYRDTHKNDFVASLIEIAHEHGSYTLLPMGERVTRWAVAARARLRQHGVAIPVGDIDAYEQLSNKGSFRSLCDSVGIKVPRERSLDPKRFEGKCVVKPRELASDERVLSAPVLIESPRAYQRFLKRSLDMTQHIVEDFVTGPSVYYMVLYERGNKRLHFVQKNTRQQPGGKSVIKAVRDALPAEIVEKLDRMFSDIKWHGVAMVELKKSQEDGRYYGIECNPRFWGPLQLAIDHGINFPLSLVMRENYEHYDRKKVGYLWTTGFWHSVFLSIKTATPVQRWLGPTQGVKFRDVWLRTDSIVFGIFEPVIILIREVAVLLRLNNLMRLFKQTVERTSR